jgi:RimJ/RimL family protein N-acetyltransferase
MELDLHTDRLRLRPLTMNDTDHLLQMFQDPQVMRYYKALKNRQETENWIQRNLERYARNGFGLWAAEWKSAGDFAGQCGLIRQEVDGESQVEIAYMFRRKYWGQGLATEAARACREVGVEQFGFTKMISLIDPANKPSIRVAQKNGMTLEKRILKWGREVSVYAWSASPATISKR